MKLYPVQMEIGGPLAMWSRPDTGSTPVSYPAPTYSAIIGILESIAWRLDAIFIPRCVHICRPIRYGHLSTNYCGPARKTQSIYKGVAHQIRMIILEDVCYRIFADAQAAPEAQKLVSSPGHALQAMFNHRLTSGRQFKTPFLGLKEFTPTYWGPFRESTTVQADINETIPSMLTTVWDKPVNGAFNPTFSLNVRIVNGVLTYDK